jgi:hypothetical protein
MHNRFVLEPLTFLTAAAAFAETCARSPEASDEARALMARRIVDSASLGIRDPELMRDDALSFLRG